MSDFDQKFESVLTILGALIPLMSAVASFLNHKVRSAQEAGSEVSPIMLKAGSALNVGALNLDKAVQLAKMAKAQKTKKAAPVEETAS